MPVNQTIQCLLIRRGMNNDRKGLGRGGRDLIYIPGTCLERLRKPMKSLYNSRLSTPEWKTALPEGRPMFSLYISPQIHRVGRCGWIYLVQCGEKLGTDKRAKEP
jgi:hypothetical protein